MKNKKQSVILHGECMIFRSTLPKNAVQKTPSNGNYHIVAESEVTGNHHVVDSCVGVTFFEDENNTLYMKNDVPTNVRCVIAERHDAIVLEPNTWEFGTQKEYDHIKEEITNVRD